jgi:uncharacterized membrane protein
MGGTGPLLLGGIEMAKFFGNLNAVLAVGFAAMLVLLFWSNSLGNTAGWMTFLHVLSGIMWIGLLYYFNFVQIPTMPTVPAELKPGVSKYIAPKALWWFRYGALATVVTGILVAILNGYAHEAFTLQDGFRLIGIGMWLALIMAANVWFVIWPNQKKALGIVEADADTKAKAATTAMMFSRTNCLLSIPMLFCMVLHRLGGAM